MNILIKQMTAVDNHEIIYTESGPLYNKHLPSQSALTNSCCADTSDLAQLSLLYLSDCLYFHINSEYCLLHCPADLRCAQVQTEKTEQKTYSSCCPRELDLDKHNHGTSLPRMLCDVNNNGGLRVKGFSKVFNKK